MRKLLALDQSSKTSGYAVFYDKELKHYGHFTFEDDDLGDRLYKIRKKVNELIEKYEINEVVFEDIQLQNNVGNNVKTFKVLAEVFGVIYELITELKLPHQEILASTWKSGLGIKGRTRPDQKRNAQKYVLNTYNMKATQDECDAICIGTHILLGKKQIADHDWSD